MRWLALSLPAFVLSLCGAIGGGSSIGSNPSAIGGGSVGSDAGAPAVDCGSPPSGATYLFDADNVDGTNNSTMSNGAFVSTWKNLGSLGATGDATQVGGNAASPVFLANAISGKPGLAFDGITDLLNIGGSKASMRGLVSTGKTGHIAIVYRHDGPRGTLSRTIFGNTNTSSTPGIAIGYSGATGGYQFLIGQASTGANALNQPRPVMAKQQILQLWADGSNYSFKSNAVAGTQTGSLAAVVALTSDTSNFMGFGCNGAVISDCSDGVFAWMAYWPANLSAGDQTTLENYLTCKYSF